MAEAVPIIYTIRAPRARLSLGMRAVAMLIALACLATFVAAGLLEPNARGTGTHTGLGFRSCQFLVQTGLPCPSCGMTTSFAWFVRGNLPASFWVQPAGTLVAIAAGLAFWVCLYLALTGRPAHRLLQLLPAKPLLIGVLLFGILAWGWKIWTTRQGIGGWGY